MANILLVSANRESMPYPVFPLGVAYVESALAAAGHATAVFDANCHDPADAPAALAALAERLAPDLVGLSIRNIDNLTYPTSVSYLDDIRRLAESARLAAPRAPLLLGGAGYSLFPEETLAALDADAGLIGEAEARLPAAIDALLERAPLDAVGGLVYRDRGGLRRTRPPTPAELRFPPEPPRRAGLDLAFYDRQGGMGNVQTKRGCPFHCSYCTYPLLEGHRFQVRPAERVADEVESLAAGHGVDYLYFVDNYFNHPIEHAEAVCRALTRRRLQVRWSCFAHPAHVTPALAETMRRAGCSAVELGTDAGSPAMLRSLNKEMTPDQILAASRACRDAGLPFAHYLLLGGPGETDRTLAETFDLMDRCEPTAVIVMCGIRIYPGTPIERQARAEGLVRPGASLLEPRFYLSPAVRATLLDRVAEAAAHRPHWIVPGLAINLSPRLMQFLRARGHKGPLWELLADRK